MMKFLHLSDLHLGKRVNEFSMLDEQAHILSQILDIADAEQPDAVLIAGDVYDKSTPSAEAVSLFDDFLCRLSERRLRTFIISGNHDSPERLAFGERLMRPSGVYISPAYHESAAPVPVSDAYGTVYLYMLPFVKPAHVRAAYPDEADDIRSYTDAICAAVAHMGVDPAARNVLMTHQFVTGATRSDSESVNVGGADNVDVSAFAPFDYVALGHLHAPQNVGRASVRYCGTPLKYSFSEVKHEKSVTVVELAEKGNVHVRTAPLRPKHDWRELRGTYEDLTLKKNYDGTAVDDYLRIILTDEDDIPDAMRKLQTIYPNLMKLDYDNRRTRSNAHLDAVDGAESQSPPELFAAFYELQNGRPMDDAQKKYVRDLMEEIWEGEL